MFPVSYFRQRTYVAQSHVNLAPDETWTHSCRLPYVCKNKIDNSLKKYKSLSGPLNLKYLLFSLFGPTTKKIFHTHTHTHTHTHIYIYGVKSMKRSKYWLHMDLTSNGTILLWNRIDRYRQAHKDLNKQVPELNIVIPRDTKLILSGGDFVSRDKIYPINGVIRSSPSKADV